MSKEIIKLYEDGNTVKGIGEMLSMTPYHVKKILVESGVYVPVKRRSNKDNIAIVEKAAECYLVEGKTLKEVREIYDVPAKFLSEYLKSQGYALRTSEVTNRKHSLNTEAFKHYTPESVYWAGFLAGDGCVYSVGKRMAGKLNILNLALASKDKEHVESFKEFVQYSGKLSIRKESVSITINSRELVKHLEEKYGINNHKTYSYVPPDNIPTHLKKYFILGLIDADGSFLRHKRNNQTLNRKRGDFVYQIGFTGTLESCMYVRDFFGSSVKIHKRHKERDNNNYTVLFQGNQQVLNYGNKIYDDTSKNFCLQRKYQNYCELKKEYSRFLQ